MVFDANNALFTLYLGYNNQRLITTFENLKPLPVVHFITQRPNFQLLFYPLFNNNLVTKGLLFINFSNFKLMNLKVTNKKK